MALPVIDFNTGRVVETDPFLATEAADFSTPQSGFGRITGGLGDIFSGLMGAGQSILSSPDALTGIAGGLLTKEAYDRLSNIGEQAKREAMGLAERGQMESEFRPFTVTTPTGAMFTARMGGQPSRQLTPLPDMPIGMVENIIDQPTGVLPPGMTEREFLARGGLVPYVNPDDMSNDLISNLRRMDSTPLTPQPPIERRLTGALPTQPTADGLQIGMELSPEERALQQQLIGGAGTFFGQAAQPTVDREQAIFERMRAAQRPEEERQRLALEERLAAQGRLGTSSAAYGGATPELLALSAAEREARDRSMLTAMQQAQAEQAQQAALGGQFLGAGYLPQQQLVAALQPGLIQQELAQQAQQFGTGLFGETALSGIEAQLLQEQARANLLGGIGSNLITGLMNQQRAAAAQPSGGGSSGLGGLFGDIVDDLGTVGSGIRRLFNF